MIVTPDQSRSTQVAFFRLMFREHKGYLCVARIKRETRSYHEEFFEWSFDAVDVVLEYVAKWANEYDMYVCPMLLAQPKRQKEYVDVCPVAWADLDTCDPKNMRLEPNVIIETSPGRWQAYWLFVDPVDPATAEDLSRRIAYAHADEGADRSGWDLTQLLRIPGTVNFKYQEPLGYPEVKIIRASIGTLYTTDDLEGKYPQVKGFEFASIPLPDDEDLPQKTADELLIEKKNRLPPTVARLFQEEPDEDWSRSLWQLEHLLYEGGLTRDEAYVVCREAACNKYRRDGRPTLLLWKEVCRVYDKRDAEYSFFRRPGDQDKNVLSDDEVRAANNVHTVVDEYVDWARGIGDAAWQYHQASAFITLSSLLSGTVKLPTSFGTIVPNLWFMILADTTLTRKTTAMDLGMDLLQEIDPDAVLATDGSIEGLYQALSLRRNRPSVFLRDEFSGLLDAMSKKDYMAGTAEALTKLYDGKYQKRILRKETIEIRDPVLLVFAGGIKSRVQQLLTYEQVASGFLPRFIIITAESDISKLQPLGPPTERSIGERDRIRNRFATIANHYAGGRTSSLVLGGAAVSQSRPWEAQLTPDAWSRYNKIESDLLAIGLASDQRELLTPTLDRLAKSGLKVAVLIAAARRLVDEVTVTEEDLIKAFSFVEYWRTFIMDVLKNLGMTSGESQIQNILKLVEKSPGISRGQIMQRFHLAAIDTSRIFETMEQRGMVVRQKVGRGERLWPIK